MGRSAQSGMGATANPGTGHALPRTAGAAMSITMQCCTGCHKLLPMTAEFFYMKRGGKRCKVCHLARCKQYQEANRERRRAYLKARREHIKARRRHYYKAKHEHIRANR